MVYLKKGFYHENNKKNSCTFTAFVLCLTPLSFTALAIDYTPEVVFYNY